MKRITAATRVWTPSLHLADHHQATHKRPPPRDPPRPTWGPCVLKPRSDRYWPAAPSHKRRRSLNFPTRTSLVHPILLHQHPHSFTQLHPHLSFTQSYNDSHTRSPVHPTLAVTHVHLIILQPQPHSFMEPSYMHSNIPSPYFPNTTTNFVHPVLLHPKRTLSSFVSTPTLQTCIPYLYTLTSSQSPPTTLTTRGTILFPSFVQLHSLTNG